MLKKAHVKIDVYFIAEKYDLLQKGGISAVYNRRKNHLQSQDKLKDEIGINIKKLIFIKIKAMHVAGKI